MTLSRYYGPGYERGHWPYLRSVLDWLRANWSGVRYEPDTYVDEDSYDLGARCLTDEDVATLQAHWDAVGNEPYIASFRSPPQRPT